MLNLLKSPLFYLGAGLLAVLLFFGTIQHDDIRLKQKAVSAVAFNAVAPGMLYEVDPDPRSQRMSFPLCRLHDAENAFIVEPYNKVFYNWVGTTLPVVQVARIFFDDGQLPEVAIPLSYTVELLDPDFEGGIRSECEQRAVAAIRQRGQTICVVDSVIRLKDANRSPYGVRFKEHAFAPEWTDWSDPPRCGLGAPGLILPVRQAFIADRNGDAPSDG